VQIITIVAADSYEEHVLSLVRNKQNLFDNVVSEDAVEDVVGVSKKLLETLIEDLAPPDVRADAVPKGPDDVPDDVSDDEAGDAAQTPLTPTSHEDPAASLEITRCIEGLQNAFGARIERIFGAGGGLVAVIDRVDAEADQIAVRLSGIVPVALVDLLTLQGLSRLGSGSPMAATHTYYDASARDRPATSPKSRLATMAEEKMRAAGLLLEQQLVDSALEMLLSSLLAAAADRAGRDIPIPAQEAGVWIFGEAIPQGVLSGEEAMLFSRAIGLAQAASVPEALVRSLAEDAGKFIAALPSFGGTP